MSSVPVISWASVVEGPIIDPANGHDYCIVSEGSWTQTEADAESIGGNLVTINNAAEDRWIVNNLTVDFSISGGPNLSDVPLWIGLYDPTQDDGDGAQHAADFVWSNGEAVNYTNWYTGEPNNRGSGEYWTAINWYYAFGDGAIGTWNDVLEDGSTSKSPINTDGPYYGVAEVVPEPSNLALFASAALASVTARRRSTTDK